MTASRRALILIVACAALGALLVAGPGRATAVGSGVSVVPAPTPAYDGDAPDPDVVFDPSVGAGGTYFAFSTGTTLAGYLQVLCDPASTPGAPVTGWAPCPGFPFGPSALPFPPAWEEPGTQNAPGAYQWNGRWILFYTAAQFPSQGDTGQNCLSVATSTGLTPQDPLFIDRSTAPLLCDTALGGAIDPSPFVDPATGTPYLIWKTNDGGSTQPARLWSQMLGPDGATLVGQPHQLQVQDTVGYPFETTIENPQMVDVGGTYFLLFSTGTWDSTSYGETAVECAGPLGPCDGPVHGPFLTSYGAVAGPGGGMFFQDASGAWYLAYAAWPAGCTDYGCGGARRLFVAPVTLAPYPLTPPATGIASLPDGRGYWLVDAFGGVSAHGSAALHGSMLGSPLNAPIEHLVPTPDGNGYWLVASDGGIFSFGDARFFGSMGGQPLNAPVVDLAPTPDGNGYWLVASDGGVFAFGDAVFRGSMGGSRLNQPVVGIAADPATDGYWLVASDGGIFSFGAPFEGSTGSLTLARPVNGMAATADGQGYWFVASDGGVFAFGDAPFRGSAGGLTLAAPITGMAVDTATDGYWLVGQDGGVFAYGAPFAGAG
ncbi:MAG TPA: family 43 glycosylhydrolase [Acidimicrobiales bacterium]|nr:family 43 glycosylhydrolase [Acidimicrobiales bacterium]